MEGRHDQRREDKGRQRRNGQSSRLGTTRVWGSPWQIKTFCLSLYVPSACPAQVPMADARAAHTQQLRPALAVRRPPHYLSTWPVIHHESTYHMDLAIMYSTPIYLLNRHHACVHAICQCSLSPLFEILCVQLLKLSGSTAV